MGLAAQVAVSSGVLSEDQIRGTLTHGLEGRFRGQRVLILIPDHTRTVPLPLLFRLITEILHDARQLDFMVALGTHLPLGQAELNHLVGTQARAPHIRLMNHVWQDANALITIGTIRQDEVKALAGEVWHPSLGGDVPVQINRAALEADHIVILGPTFPHEVVGFSGGAKYLFPGIAGPEIINITHWMGALMTILNTIGIEQTPMRAMIHRAASYILTPITLVSLVVDEGGLAGVFAGDVETAFHAAAQLSSQRHIIWLDQPYQRVLSHAPVMYDELWTGAKAMYKLEPGIADGGEVIIHAPHLSVVSAVHGQYLYRTGYHVRDYFLKQWKNFQDVPLGVLAHSTHLKGSGIYENGIEKPRIKVTLASRVSAEDCARLNLGYLNPDDINVKDWKNREAEGILFVPKAGEYLYRVKEG
ncbi:MAG TPA: lactate racemase domain-containing protein [Aggregatilineaceae bacterium]|nr:lactate racemase domain-containing protein [Aggregatilineaceae bacterium]